MNALTFSSTGVLYAAGVNTSKIYTINTSTGAATAVATETNSSADNSAGDLAFIGSTLYLTTGVTGDSVLDTVNLSTGAVTPIGTNTGFTNVFGLTYSYGVLYGFTQNVGAAEVISINTTTGVGTAVHSYAGTGDFFGFNGTTNDAAPEPATLGAMALGLAGLAGVAYRRHKA